MYPLVVASQAVPVVVIAPILVIWFGFGMTPKLIVIALICFFPIVVNTLDGLRVGRPRAGEDAAHAGRLAAGRCFRRLELPAALPYLFSGAKVAVAVAVIGAVFGELVGSDAGLGHAIQVGTAQLLTARVFAAVVILSRDGDRAVRSRVGAGAARRALGRAAGGSGMRRLPPSRSGRGRAGDRRAACAGLRREVRGSSAGTPERRELDLTLDWFPNPDHVAIYEALDQGYFRDVGLDVRPRVPSDPSAPIKQVAAGRTDLAISYEPEVFLAREQGLPVVAVAALVQRPLTSLMATRKSGVRSVRDLRGKRVGTAGIPYQSAYLKTILAAREGPRRPA